jgi:rRNA maturation endonuclease Nob1
MIVLAAVLVALGALLYTLSIRREDLPPAETASPTAVLEERKAAIYENLRDLQFEFRVGKLSDEDYQRAKQDLQRELAQVLAEIDRLSGAPAASPAAASVAAPAQPSSLICPACGSAFDQPMKFCGNCGKPMTGGAA